MRNVIISIVIIFFITSCSFITFKPVYVKTYVNKKMKKNEIDSLRISIIKSCYEGAISKVYLYNLLKSECCEFEIYFKGLSNDTLILKGSTSEHLSYSNKNIDKLLDANTPIIINVKDTCNKTFNVFKFDVNIDRYYPIIVPGH